MFPALIWDHRLYSSNGTVSHDFLQVSYSSWRQSISAILVPRMKMTLGLLEMVLLNIVFKEEIVFLIFGHRLPIARLF